MCKVQCASKDVPAPNLSPKSPTLFLFHTSQPHLCLCPARRTAAARHTVLPVSKLDALLQMRLHA